MSIVEEVEEVKQRMRDAEDYLARELRAAEARAFVLPVEEVMRRNNAALADLLSGASGKCTWR